MSSSKLLLVVDDATVLPDLAIGGGLDLDGCHLPHGPFEIPIPPRGDERVVDHLPRRRLRRQQGGVGAKEHLVVQHVPIVLLV